jgi:4-hydroxy-3-polyprenylbenzoate decarboxylase
MKHKIVVAIGGSSGSLYAKLLLDKLSVLREQVLDVGIVMSDNAKYNWELEIGGKSYQDYDFTLYKKSDFNAPFASGSAKYGTMIVCPCSMGVLGRIASGVSNDLTTRAADVILKERRKLILVPRETPLSLIHIDNMRAVTLAGGIICPAVPSFYSKPQSAEEIMNTVVDRVLDLAGLDIDTYRWNS